ncbi:MAG: preprotein translocase subunit SecY [Lachnospiraceae bacterium]|nr:preprotein translocase subunit SecY [Candidatus Merdinaster equi]
MFKTLKNAFKVKDIRSRILFTLLMLVVIRIGSQLPMPGIDASVIQNWLKSNLGSGDTLNFLSAFTGGSFEKMSIFALSITPYITSSIIIQLLTIAIPKLEEMQRDGEEGKKKLAAITRYVTVVLSLIESAAMAIGFGSMLQPYNAFTVIGTIAVLTAGSSILMWIGERITDRGIGNGISIVLIINIISRMPEDIKGLYDMFIQSRIDENNIAMAVVAGLVIIAIILVVVVLVIILNDGVRKIPVQYAKKLQGRKLVGGQTTNIPLKVNTSGVIPIIFASSLMQLPIMISSFCGYQGTGVWSHILKGLNSGWWFKTGSDFIYTIGLVFYIVLVLFFAYFYTAITFNPLEVSENMKKQGGFIPGIRPGKPTSEYLQSVLNYIIFIGAVGLVIVAVVPIVCNGLFNASVSFGGTSLIIVVSVILETMKQVESQMLVRNYKGFLNDK